MIWIIILVICALFAALNGDSSGVIAIAKIIGIGTLILGIMWIFANCPWLIVIVVLGFLIFFICQPFKNVNNSTIIDNYEGDKTQTEDNRIISNPNLTGFKAELQEKHKNPNPSRG